MGLQVVNSADLHIQRAIQVRHVPTMCTFQDRSLERWNGEGTVQSDWRGDAQPKWPDLGSTEFGEIWRSSIHGVRMLRVGLR